MLEFPILSMLRKTGAGQELCPVPDKALNLTPARPPVLVLHTVSEGRCMLAKLLGMLGRPMNANRHAGPLVRPVARHLATL
jgi:hypothetical protein